MLIINVQFILSMVYLGKLYLSIIAPHLTGLYVKVVMMVTD
jgi:hypothetical protein